MAVPDIGQALRVRERELSPDYYYSRLVESTDADLYIEVPLHMEQRRPLSAETNRRFWVEFHARDGALCRFESHLLEVVRLPVTAWRIQKPPLHAVIREQRREFVRVPTDLPVRLEYFLEHGLQKVHVHAFDISGGGIAVWIPRTVILRPGATVSLHFTLPRDEFAVDVQCTVVRVSDRNDRGYAIASMQFMNIKESVRQRIIQYTFWRQRQINPK
ncbi:MAG: PilZ domain-containing protein [Alicyclobacillus sp.]|nr:PilZ domain-containing protein [Alicyclobacillus sp.]